MALPPYLRQTPPTAAWYGAKEMADARKQEKQKNMLAQALELKTLQNQEMQMQQSQMGAKAAENRALMKSQMERRAASSAPLYEPNPEIAQYLQGPERDEYLSGKTPRFKNLETQARVNQTQQKKMGESKVKPETLRKEFISVTKDFDLVNSAYGRIAASAQDPSAAGDMALIFNYMKMLDPGSTVREGEFATAQNATNVPGQVLSLYNRIVDGTRLNPEQRKDFVGRAGMLYKQALSGYDNAASEYKRLAQLGGVDPEQVIINRATMRDYQMQGEAPPQETANTQSLEEVLRMLQERPELLRQITEMAGKANGQ